MTPTARKEPWKLSWIIHHTNSGSECVLSLGTWKGQQAMSLLSCAEVSVSLSSVPEALSWMQNTGQAWLLFFFFILVAVCGLQEPRCDRKLIQS